MDHTFAEGVPKPHGTSIDDVLMAEEKMIKIHSVLTNHVQNILSNTTSAQVVTGVKKAMEEARDEELKIFAELKGRARFRVSGYVMELPEDIQERPEVQPLCQLLMEQMRGLVRDGVVAQENAILFEQFLASYGNEVRNRVVVCEGVAADAEEDLKAKLGDLQDSGEDVSTDLHGMSHRDIRILQTIQDKKIQSCTSAREDLKNFTMRLPREEYEAFMPALNKATSALDSIVTLAESIRRRSGALHAFPPRWTEGEYGGSMYSLGLNARAKYYIWGSGD